MLFLDYNPELTALEYEVYRFVSKNLASVSKMKMKELAKVTHTSTASISRFCKKFECDTFTEFKINLRFYLDSLVKSKISDSDESQTIDFLKRVNQPFLSERIDRATEILKNKSFVLFIGSGLSETIAEYGALYFTDLGKTALKVDDPSNYPIDWFPEDILCKTGIIGLSISGETQEMIRYLQKLNQKDCQIIAITNTEDSTISQLSDLTVPYYIERETIFKASQKKEKTIELTSQLPAIYLIEKIAKRIRLSEELL
ncbi:MurR/RpiR family transcriptional regulator [Enterococcus casseliflavus]|uniref:MurR/RpiR family transcriptional regulator n=1 Tax=Enterococcus casseliflavus TaxID=37734 RepID=UPI00232B994E|nr:MurR/RpiR family transcriptional regulator [Enterococcus casseliflavus]MDB1687331.1 MurR/RpiR family transcriptional regulator [Enterococcus casseliflavus]